MLGGFRYVLKYTINKIEKINTMKFTLEELSSAYAI